MASEFSTGRWWNQTPCQAATELAGTMTPALRGAAPSTVRAAIETRDPLPGTSGFAGEIDGRLVRDVLGRELLYVDASHDSDAGAAWSFDPAELTAPRLVPAGHCNPLEQETTRQYWTLPASTAADNTTALTAVRKAVTERLASLDPSVPVAFSGGLDSGVLASATTGPLYVCGFPESPDVTAAREGAVALDRELRVIELTHQRLREAVTTVAQVTGRTNPMDISIALPLYLTAQEAAKDGYDRLLLGQGADELFGGYAKVARAPEDSRVEATSIRGARDEMIETLPTQLERDIRAIRAAGVAPMTPLLHDQVIAAALKLPGELLVDDERRKVALRMVASDRLPAALHTRDKKAIQYGSYVSRELDRLARQAGYKRRMDNHVQQYVEALLADSAE